MQLGRTRTLSVYLTAALGVPEWSVLVADLDLALIDEVRTTWQFYRDRRPETYGELTELLP